MAKLFDDRAFRDRFLDQIRAGHGRYAACRIVQINPATFTAYYKAHADFREEVDAALDESIEPVLASLRELAESGDVTAAKEYLKHMAPPPRSEANKGSQTVNVNVTHELDPAQLSSIAALEARLSERRSALPAADYEQEYEDDDE